MINVFFRLSEAELGTLAASGIHSIQREWNGFNIDVWSHCRSGINEVWSQTWGFGRLHACVCTSVRRLRKCVLHRQFLILFRIENLPHGGFPSTCLIIFIHHVHSFIYLYFSSFPLFFLLLFFLCSTSLLHTHICTGNDGVIFSSADRKSDEEDQGAVQHLRVVNSNPVSQTHTEMRTHTQVQVDSHALAINPTETVNKTEVQLCIQVCSAFNSGYYKLHFKLCKHKMSESIKGLNYAYWSLFSMQLPWMENRDF